MDEKGWESELHKTSGGELEDTSTLPNTYNYCFNQKLYDVQHKVESVLEHINTLRENYPNI